LLVWLLNEPATKAALSFRSCSCRGLPSASTLPVSGGTSARSVWAAQWQSYTSLPRSGRVLADRVVVGRIFKVPAAPVGLPWMWTLDLWISRGPHADAGIWGNTGRRINCAIYDAWKADRRSL